MPITDRQQAFVNYYCNNGFNAAQAYKSAYPNCKTGHNKLAARVMARDGIKVAISEKIAKRQAELDYDQRKATQLLFDLLERCKAAKDHNTEATVIRELNTIFALRKEGAVTGQQEQQQLTEQQAAEARRLAGIRLRQPAG